MKQYNIEVLCICALRYALGRSSYVTEEIAEIIRENINELSNGSMLTMKRDIEHTISNKKYGTEIDKRIWESLLDNLNNVLGK